MMIATCNCASGTTWQRLRGLLAADIAVYRLHAADYQAGRRNGVRATLSALLTPQLLCVALYRLAHQCQVSGWPRLALTLERANLLAHKIEVRSASCIGPGLYIPHPVSVVFEGTAGARLTLAAKSCCMRSAPWLGDGVAECPRLGDDVTLGGTSLVEGSISVGDRGRLGMQAVASEDVPAATTLVARAFRARIVRRPA